MSEEKFNYKKWGKLQRRSGRTRMAVPVKDPWTKKFLRILWRTMKGNVYLLPVLLAVLAIPFAIVEISIINACRWALTSIGAFITGCGIDTFMTIRGGQHETNN